MKPIFTLICLSTLLGANGQNNGCDSLKGLNKKIRETHQNPKTAIRAAHADVLLVPSRKWTSGHPQIPAHYTLGPNPVSKPKQ